MALRHGIYVSIPKGLPPGTRIASEQVACFRYGIAWVFEALRAGPFITDPGERSRIAGLHHHFTEITQRFLFSLQHLNELMERMAVEFDRSHMSMLLPKITLEAGCQADHVLTYLNSMLDDIALCIICATGFASGKRPIDSLGSLKHVNNRSKPKLAPVRGLLTELDDANSWWELGFKTGVGARQLLIHNQHVVEFQGARSPGCPMEAQAFLQPTTGQRVSVGDFFALLRELLAKLCDWLDRLETALTAILPVHPKPSYAPKEFCPRILFPLGHPVNGIRYSEQYFPLPLCDGSDPLPWIFAPPVFKADQS